MRNHKNPLLMSLIDVIEPANSDRIYVVIDLAEGIECVVYEDITQCPVNAQELKKFPQLQGLSTLVT